jgi:hypothetical protein
MASLLISLIIKILRVKSNPAYLFLGFALLTSTYGIFINQLLFSGLIFQYPYLFKTASPFHYVSAPLYYLFVVLLLHPKRGFKKIDLIHFLPFILHLIELLPFYLSSNAVKLELLNDLMLNKIKFTESNNGLFSVQQHFVLKYSISILYFIYLLYVIKPLQFLKKEKQPFFQKNKLLLNWLIIENFVKIIIHINL